MTKVTVEVKVREKKMPDTPVSVVVVPENELPNLSALATVVSSVELNRSVQIPNKRPVIIVSLWCIRLGAGHGFETHRVHNRYVGSSPTTYNRIINE